jgi:hypothetical protein
MRYMASNGDTVCTWGETEIEGVEKLDVEEVQKRFDSLIKDGYSAVDVSASGTRVVDGITGTEAEVVMFPNVVAG